MYWGPNFSEFARCTGSCVSEDGLDSTECLQDGPGTQLPKILDLAYPLLTIAAPSTADDLSRVFCS